MMPFDFITEKFAERQAILDEQEREREEAAIISRLEKLREDAVKDCNLMFAEHVKACQESESDFTKQRTDIDGITVTLTNFYHEEREERITQVWAFHPELDEVPLVTYSSNSVREPEEWMPLAVPLDQQ